MEFSGAKLALFLGQELLVILRDNRPDIPYPGHWDLPGGGREGDETPQACVLRETQEEVGLKLTENDLGWSSQHMQPHGKVWFFVAHLPKEVASKVMLGDEGQGWRTMTPEEYCEHPLSIDHFSMQLRCYLSQPEKPI